MVSVEPIAIVSGARRRSVRPPRSAADGRSRRGTAPDRRADGGGHGVPQRVKVEPLMFHHGCVEHHGDPPAVSLSAANGVTEPGSMPRVSRISSAEPNEKRPLAPSGRCKDFSSMAASSSAVTRNTRALLVAQEQVLRVPARNLAAQRPRLLDREQRRMRHGRVGDAEPVEKGEKVVGGRGHGGYRGGLDAGIAGNANFGRNRDDPALVRRRQRPLTHPSGRAG